MTTYLTEQRGCSVNTVIAYRDAIVLMLTFYKEQIRIPAEKLTLKDITMERILSYLEWIEKQRHCSSSTRNARLAAIHAFFRFLQYRNPEQMEEWQRIIAIKIKKTPKPQVAYLTQEAIKLFLSQPDPSMKKGMRDLVMLSIMIESGARVQEIADLTPSKVHFGDPTVLCITGKGNKTRIIPFSKQAAELLKNYMVRYNLLEPYANEYPLFGNGRRGKLSRMGISAIVKKYAESARKIDMKLIPAGITPHSLRHSKAMLMMKSGANLICIRDFLGHQSVSSTEIYARIDNQQKLDAINKTSLVPANDELPSWQSDNGLLHWLERLGK
ncbi:MAG TPA: tyrosine-type recombinase/integrase [Ignavibacteria bacterium]|nr:tyrosine-type recombinase/integrase [Ignavibacteria bacterium]